jgi:hypothetical protein
VLEALTFTDTLARLDLMVGQPVSLILGSDEVGTFPLLLVNGELRRSEDVGAPIFNIVSGASDSSRLALPEQLFKAARWDENTEALLITTTAGLLQITTRQVAGISKRR